MKRILFTTLLLGLLAGCDDSISGPRFLGRAHGASGTFDVFKVDPGRGQPYVYVAQPVDLRAPTPLAGRMLDPPVQLASGVIRINPGFGLPYIYVVPGAGTAWRSGKTTRYGASP